MELKIVDPHQESVCAQFGISEDRIEYLCDQMDIITKRHLEAGRDMPKSQIFNEIAKLCNTTEELVICIHANSCFMYELFGQ